MKAQRALQRTQTKLQLSSKFPRGTLNNTEIDERLFFLFPPTPELGWISKVYVNQPAVVRHAEQIQKWRTVKGNWQVSALFMHSVPVFLKQSLSLSRLQY